MFWQGDLSPMELACIRSFLARNIRVNVFSYESLDLPAGACLHDAVEILPEEELFYFQGSPSAFTNIFRYKLLLERGGWWVDTDVLMLQDTLPKTQYYWAWQDPDQINGAVLLFPRGDPLCEQLLDLSIEGAKTLDRWGALGPELLTNVLADVQVDNMGTTQNTYPIHYLEVHYLWFPEFAELARSRLDNACFLHLWHAMFGRMGMEVEKGPPQGSFLQRVIGSVGMSRASEKERRAVSEYLSADGIPEFAIQTLGRPIELPSQNGDFD